MDLKSLRLCGDSLMTLQYLRHAQDAYFQLKEGSSRQYCADSEASASP